MQFITQDNFIFLLLSYYKLNFKNLNWWALFYSYSVFY